MKRTKPSEVEGPAGYGRGDVLSAISKLLSGAQERVVAEEVIGKEVLMKP